MDMPTFSAAFGELHGRTSFQINGEDNMRGRKVWHRFQDRCMRSDRHFYTSLNYIHNNPVKHGYVIKWSIGLFRACIGTWRTTGAIGC
jgi:putative transposase